MSDDDDDEGEEDEDDEDDEDNKDEDDDEGDSDGEAHSISECERKLWRASGEGDDECEARRDRGFGGEEEKVQQYQGAGEATQRTWRGCEDALSTASRSSWDCWLSNAGLFIALIAL